MNTVSVEEYLQTYYEPDMEYVDGRLVDRHVGEILHARLHGLIGAALGSNESGYRTFLSVRVRVSEDPPRYRIPDVSVKALPHQMTPFLVQPDLVVEVLSRDDETSDFLEKIADCVGAGIPYIWIVDPYKRTVTAVEQGVIRNVPTAEPQTPLVGSVDFNELFRQLYE